jgi:hypothetical protein
MGNERNSRYAGSHTLMTGDRITVEYLDRRACDRLFNGGLVRRNDPRYRKIGWYWTAYRGLEPKSSLVARWHGPFSASGVALNDARARFAETAKGQGSRNMVRENAL